MNRAGMPLKAVILSKKPAVDVMTGGFENLNHRRDKNLSHRGENPNR